MGTIAIVSVPKLKKYAIFLNISLLLLVSVFLLSYINSTEFAVLNSYRLFLGSEQQACEGLVQLDDYKSKCFYLKTHGPCVSQGYIDYLYLFYCKFGGVSVWGYFLLFLWLLVLFYLLGNTASEYFCSSLESLSKLLKLSPTIAGVTLLSLGNGAPDVFSILVSFMDSGTCDVGLSTVLGGASFVTCVVVGIISILIHEKQIKINKHDFLRDICFFLLVLAFLILIFLHNQTNLWGALGFSSMYVVYVLLVYIPHVRRNNGGEDSESDAISRHGSDELSLMVPFLGGEVNNCSLCMRTTQAACNSVLHILEMPLSLPRRLTIPVVCEKKWSKPFAVASVTLAPIFVSVLWIPQDENGSFNPRFVVYAVGLMLGITCGVIAFVRTDKSSPPRKFLLPWLAGGFIMSVIWSYLIAQELLGLLVSLGYIFSISPSILGLTVLAWGNSLGDLITNITMALNGGPEGVQIAISGCYAGPIFNTLVGLGLSLIGSSWFAYPSPVVISMDPYLLEILSFVAAGLLWALVVLPRSGMRLNGLLGGGLLAIYLISLSLRLIQAFGYFQLH